MKVITATMAKNIANDFLNNACGNLFKNTMDDILLKAEQGKHSTYMLVPSTWDCITKNNAAMFFSGLGYEVVIHPNAITISW